MPALIRVGHRGAPVFAPDNTIAGFDAALAIGVDMIEFDILPARGSSTELYIAHDYGALDPSRSLTLTAALEHFSTAPYAGIRLQLDIKRRGVEQPVLEALDATGTRSRAFISTGLRGVLPRFRALAPEIRLGWTVPDIPGIGSAPGLSRLYAARIPARAGARIRAGEIDALVPHFSLVNAALVEAVSAAGGEIYVWTVNSAAELSRLAALGVTGVITNDPRLFSTIEHTDAL
jgi:glycerophosphoryl diester phosphodiesterase